MDGITLNASILTPNSGSVARPMHPFEPQGEREFRNFLQQSSPLNDSNTRNTRRKLAEKEINTVLKTPQTPGLGESVSLYPQYIPKFQLFTRRYKT